MAARRFQDQLKLKKRRRRRLKTFAALGTVFLIAGGIIYLLLFAGIFEVKAVTVSGSETLAKEIESRANAWLDEGLWGLKRRNPFLFSTQKLEAELLAGRPKIASLGIKKRPFHQLTISLVERRPEGIWCLVKKDDCFYFDRQGVAYEHLGSSEGAIFVKISDERDRSVNLGSAAAEENLFKNINLAKELLLKSGLGIVGFVIPENSFDEFDAKTSAGWRILFDASSDISDRVAELAVFLKTKLTPQKISQLQYVDLRVKDRIYYK